MAQCKAKSNYDEEKCEFVVEYGTGGNKMGAKVG